MPSDVFIQLRSVLTAECPFNIASLAQIGLDDPYTAETNARFEVPKECEDNAYHASRYKKGINPHCLYIPSRKLMFDIMRICVGLEKID